MAYCVKGGENGRIHPLKGEKMGKRGEKMGTLSTKLKGEKMGGILYA